MTTKSLQRMAAPLMVSFTLRFMFTLVDMAYAAVLRDDNAAVAAISSYAPLESIYIALWVGLSAGFTASLSKAFGLRDEERVKRLERAMLAVLAVLIPILLAVAAGVYLVIPHLGLPPALAESLRIYATTMAVGMPLIGFWSIYPDSIVKAHQDTRSTMVAGLASTFCNVALNTLFVFGFEWGIFGIALATVLSRLAGLGYALHRMRRLERARAGAGWRSAPRDWPAPVATILRLAVPGALTHLLAAAESSVVLKVLAGLPESTTAIASFGVYQRLLMLSLMPAAGASVAVVPYVALALPAGDPARIRRDLLRTLQLIGGLALVFTMTVGWLFAEPVAGFFVSQADRAAAKAAAAPATLEALRLLPLGALAGIPFFVLRPTFEAAHRPWLGVQVSLARFVVLSVPLILAGRHLAPALGVTGLTGVILGLTAAAGLGSLWAARLAHLALAEAA